MLFTGSLTFYEIDLVYEFEQRARDEDGFLPGHGPGNGDWREGRATFHVVSNSEQLARAGAVAHYTQEGTFRGTRIEAVRRKSVHRMYIEHQG